MLLLIIFSLLLFFSVLECKKEVKYKNDLENILKTYVKPLKVLTDNLPNHEVEIQIEYQKPTERKPPPVSPRQGPLYLYNPSRFNDNKLLPSRRSNDELLVNTARRANAVSAATSLTKTAATMTAATTATTPAPAPTAPRAPPAPPPAAEEHPIYLEDLKEILNEFVDKIQGGNAGKPKKAANQPIIVSNAGPVHGNQPNLEDIMNLLKQGLQVAKRIQVPNDEEMEWLEIKLPKNL